MSREATQAGTSPAECWLGLLLLAGQRVPFSRSSSWGNLECVLSGLLWEGKNATFILVCGLSLNGQLGFGKESTWGAAKGMLLCRECLCQLSKSFPWHKLSSLGWSSAPGGPWHSSLWCSGQGPRFKCQKQCATFLLSLCVSCGMWQRHACLRVHLLLYQWSIDFPVSEHGMQQ